MAEHSRLFKPLKVGSKTLSSRLVMAPLTRFRADDDHVPLPMVATHYAQRGVVPGTLLITEATFISPQAGGYPNAPGIFSREQIAGWKRVVDAVHAKGSFIALQLWALGRAANPDTLKAEGGHDLVSASDVPIGDPEARGGGARPRPLTEDEIQQYIADYARAAKNAVEGAGFDMVEIHSANGYLPDQFLQDVSNKRTDRWGGSIENRARFTVEISRAVVEAVGADRVGIRLSPYSDFQGMRMADPVPQFSHVIEEVGKLGLAYLHLVESRIAGSADSEDTGKLDFAVDVWRGTSPVLIAGGFQAESARRLVDEERAGDEVAVVFGRFWISNPDLVFSIREGVELHPYDRSTFYTPKKEQGYIDYANSKEFEQRGKASL